MSLLRTSSSLHRQPMADVTHAHDNRDLQQDTQVRRERSKKLSSTTAPSRQPSLPHHESLQPGGDLLTAPGVPQNKRVSAVSDDGSTGSVHSSSNPTTPRKIKKYVGPWHLGKSLGHGASARVRLAEHSETGQLAAVKIISIRQAAQLQTASIMDIEKQIRTAGKTREEKVPMALGREITILKSMNHENVIRLYDIWENRGELYLFCEYVGGGELFNYIKEEVPDEIECVRLFRQIITALAYCHRSKLCHRDLKPENILLDEKCNVKLADFGMAALQKTKHLRTACGSPHYAAPEVCRSEKYVGELADIWSVGVVLYVMLFRALPFGGQCGSDDIKTIIYEVVYKRISFDEQRGVKVSWEAKDFIKKILQRSPNKRMAIIDMWDHDFLRLYEGYAQLPENQDTWLGGPVAPLSDEDCGERLRHKSDIDRAIVKAMCTLWQTSDEHHIIRSLLNPEPSYERAIYASLKKYRENQEENYMGPSIASSTSDYHHLARPLQKSATRSSLLGASSAKPKSELSIVAPPRRPSTASHGSRRSDSVADTEQSYDPYRSSRPQVAYSGESYTKVDVLREKSHASKTSTRGPPIVSRRPPTQAASSVWESTITSSMSSIPSSPPVVRDEQGHLRTIRHTEPVKRAFSTSSFGSSVSQVSLASGKQYVSRSQNHRSKVSFKRQRAIPPRPQNPTPLSQTQTLLPSEDTAYGMDIDGLETIAERHSLPEMPRARNDTSDTLRHTSRTINSANGPRTPAYTPEEEAAIVASEFSQICDTVLGPSPVPIICAGAQPTPNEILAARLNPNSMHARTLREKYEDRPLPEPPFREPNALTVQRYLLKVQKHVLKRSEEMGPVLDSALNGIEMALRTNAPKITQENMQRRVTSAPTRKASKDSLVPSPLFENDVDPFVARRHVSDPTPHHHQMYGGQIGSLNYDGPTIRFVPKSPGTPLLETSSPLTGLATSPLERVGEPRVIPRRAGSREYLDERDDLQQRISMLEARMENMSGPLQTIDESGDADDDGKRTSTGNKIKSWFSKSSNSSKSIEKMRASPSNSRPSSVHQQHPQQQPIYELPSQTPPRPSYQHSEVNRYQPLSLSEQKWQPQTQPQANSFAAAVPSFQGTYASSEFPLRAEGKTVVAPTTTVNPVSSRARDFWDFLRGRQKRDKMTLIQPDSLSITNGSQQSFHRSHSNLRRPASRQTNARSPFPTLFPHQPAPTEPQNWFAKLLQVKPAHKTLTLEISRGEATTAIADILRSWKRFGVRDVIVKTEAGSKRIWARLDETNQLDYKPVEIMIEIVAVVFSEKKGKRNAGGMSVAYMEQIKGAKSSFIQSAWAMERVLKERGLWVDDEPRAKEMKRLFREWRKA